MKEKNTAESTTVMSSNNSNNVTITTTTDAINGHTTPVQNGKAQSANGKGTEKGMINYTCYLSHYSYLYIISVI